MATLGDIATKARQKTHADLISYPDNILLIDINNWYQKIVTMIFESQDDSDYDDTRLGSGGSSGTATYPIVTQALATGQRDYQIPFSKGVLKVKRLDVTYDNVNWYRASSFDSGIYPYGMGSTTQEDANFIKQAPQYDWQYNSFFIYPTASASDVSSGAQFRVQWERNIIPFTSADWSSVMTDSTQIPGIDAPFHMAIMDGASLEFAKANLLPQTEAWEKDMQDWEARIRYAYGRKQLDTQLQLQTGYDNNYGR